MRWHKSGRNKHLITAARSFPSRGSHKTGLAHKTGVGGGTGVCGSSKLLPYKFDRGWRIKPGAEKSLLLEGRDALSKRAGGTFVAKAGSNL